MKKSQLRALTGVRFPGDDRIATLLSAVTLKQAWTGYIGWNIPGWSICAEAFFYLVFPFVIMLLAPLRRRQLFIVMAAVWVGGLAAPIRYALRLFPGGVIRTGRARCRSDRGSLARSKDGRASPKSAEAAHGEGNYS